MADVGGVPPLAFDAQDFVQRPDEEVPDEVVDHGKKDDEEQRGAEPGLP